jgi:hypothetical protein
MAGSLLGGVWSDRVLLRYKRENGGKLRSEVCMFLFEFIDVTEAFMTVNSRIA